MTVISGLCPSCTSVLEFTRPGRQGAVTAWCSTCGADYGMSPSGIAPVDLTRSATDRLVTISDWSARAIAAGD